MATLTSLSNELIHFVLNLLEPKDLENFTYTCWTIHRVAAKHLKEHQILKRQLGRVITSDANPISGVIPGRIVHHWQLLREMRLHPHKALYVKEATVKYLKGYWDGEYDLLSAYLRPSGIYSSAEKERIVSALGLKGLEEDFWKKYLTMVAEDTAALIITTMFKDLLFLENLTLEVHSYKPGVMDQFMIRAKESPGAFLPHLQSVTIQDRGQKNTWRLLSSFAALPSVRSLSGRFIDGHHLPGTRLGLAPRCSNVQDLSLYQSHANADILIQLLDGMKSLESFSYDLAGWDADGENFLEAHAALLKNTWSTLRVLHLRDSEKTQHDILSFRGFTALRELSIDFVLLMGSPPFKKRTLAGVLPVSIDSVTMFACHIYSIDCFLSIMNPLLATNKMWVPKLKELRFVDTTKLERLHGATREAIASRAEEAGFSMSVM